MKPQTLDLEGMIVASQQNFLIIDDEGEINEMIVDLLEMMGFNGTFYQAYSLEDAKRILSQNKVDYILSDWNLPDGQGISLLKAIRKSPKFENIPFLMITGNNDVDSMVLSSKVGVSEYLTKPFDIDDLQNKLVEGWKYHLVKDEVFIKKLKEKIKILESKVQELEKENTALKERIGEN